MLTRIEKYKTKFSLLAVISYILLLTAVSFHYHKLNGSPEIIISDAETEHPGLIGDVIFSNASCQFLLSYNLSYDLSVFDSGLLKDLQSEKTTFSLVQSNYQIFNPNHSDFRAPPYFS